MRKNPKTKARLYVYRRAFVYCAVASGDRLGVLLIHNCNRTAKGSYGDR